jgi:hypothetical protein
VLQDCLTLQPQSNLKECDIFAVWLCFISDGKLFISGGWIMLDGSVFKALKNRL